MKRKPTVKKILKSNKVSISAYLMRQVQDCLHLAIKARKEGQIHVEIRLSINIFLLLGITTEGIINEYGEMLFDKWTWEGMEKSTTPLKWRLISDLKFDPTSEPLLTIKEVHRLRNKIAHPKPVQHETDIIIAGKNGLLVSPDDEDVLPEGDINVYIGCKKLLMEFNARNALTKTRNVLKALIQLKSLFDIKDDLNKWPEEILSEIKSITIPKNGFD